MISPDSIPYLALAFVLGVAISFLIFQRKRRTLESELATEHEQNVRLESENARISDLDAEIKRLNVKAEVLTGDRDRYSTQAEARMGEITKLESKIVILEKTIKDTEQTSKNVHAENEGLKAKLEAEQKNFEKLKAAKEELYEKFESISNSVLSNSNQSFLTLAKETLGQYQEGAKGDLEKRQQAIDELLKPLKENLSELDKSNREMERLRTDAYATLVQQVQHLRQSDELSRQELSKLISTLDAPKPRGDWGEEQLRRIVELAGMSEHCNFDVQVHLKGDSTFRADMIVRLAGGKSIIVDAKAPWDREVFQSDNSKEREMKISIMCSNFQKHIDDLYKRDYASMVQDSPDFVVMFVPIEPVFHLVLQSDPSLISYAISKKVVLASPTTLIAMLKSVAYGWQQDAISQNAQKISTLAKELYERFGVFGKHLAGLGKNLNDSVKSYNELLNSTESRLLVSARRFKDLKVSSGPDIAEGRSIETIASFPSAMELRQEELLPAAGADGKHFER